MFLPGCPTCTCRFYWSPYLCFVYGGASNYLPSLRYHLAAWLSLRSIWPTMMLPPGHRRAMQRSPAWCPLKIRQPKRGRAWEYITYLPLARIPLTWSNQEHCVTDRPSRTFAYVPIPLCTVAKHITALGDQQPSGVGLKALRAAIGTEAYFCLRRYLRLQMWRSIRSNLKDLRDHVLIWVSGLHHKT